MRKTKISVPHLYGMKYTVEQRERERECIYIPVVISKAIVEN